MREKNQQDGQQIERVPLEALVPYARNSRTHSEAQVAQIAASIREFGFTNPVLIDADGGIIAGHGRVMAARKLGLKDVPCIALGHLTAAQKRAYVIADNKLALNAGWDEELLAVEFSDLLSEGFDLELTGFAPGETSTPDFAPGTEEDQGRLDQKKPVTCPNCGHEF
jgi:ParB family chromosome partitioning protein